LVALKGRRTARKYTAFFCTNCAFNILTFRRICILYPVSFSVRAIKTQQTALDNNLWNSLMQRSLSHYKKMFDCLQGDADFANFPQ
jgi:hypothetical protein